MTDKKPRLGLFIVRGQPVTDPHVENVHHALATCDEVAIVNGSAFTAPRWDLVPFREYHREEMWRRNFTTEQLRRIRFINQKDYGNMATWANKLRGKVYDLLGADDAPVALVGCAKDAPTGFYLSQFQDWESIRVPVKRNGLSATPIRDRFFSDCNLVQFSEWARDMLPPGTMSFLQDFRKTTEFTDILGEKDFMIDYLKGFHDPDEVARAKAESIATGMKVRPHCAPYPPTFYTGDAAVIQGTKVAMVQRNDYPGKGLWAVPGGHCEGDTALDAAIKELREETRMAVPEDVIRGSIVGEKRYDDPNRSTRKRTVTVAQFVHLNPRVKPGQDPKEALALPKIKASKESKRAVWKDIDWVENNRELIFEDHWRMISDAMVAIRK